MTGGKGHDDAFAARLARRTRLNDETMMVFTAVMVLMAAVFVALHLVRRRAQGQRPSLLVSWSRKIRKVALRRAPGLPSAGHGVLVGLYVAINMVLLFANLDNDNLPLVTNVASRAAWLAMGNLVVVVVLALKNTPLAFLTAWSYERLNFLHQVAGYMTVGLVIVHASCYSAYFLRAGRRDVLVHMQDVFGMVAGLALLLLGLAGAIIRRWWYELFYYLHVSLWMVAVVTVGLHQPDLGGKALVVTMVAGSIWLLDRLLRLTRLVLYSANNRVELTPLPHGGTRVTLAKAPVGAVSGKHCFLWIPSVRLCETHPFTIVAVDPLEFTVASYDGFTHDLHTYAVSHPGASLKASVEGTYGTIPDPAAYHTVVLVAGGSGASFTIGMALDMLRRLPSDESKHVVFIWAVKHSSYLGWFRGHLMTLKSDGRVSMQLFVTRQPGTQTATHSPCSVARASGPDMEKAIMSQSSTDSDNSDAETWTQRPSSMNEMPIMYQRPDVAALIRRAVDETPASQRVLVLGCGPDELMTPVRDTAAACIRAEGPGVEVHCEQFGW